MKYPEELKTNIWYYDEYDPEPNTNTLRTISEYDILMQYYPIWKKNMINKFGEEVFAKNWTLQDCINDWTIVNFAWKEEE